MKNFKANLQIVALFLAIGAVSANWDYCNQGYWNHDFVTCRGKNQSPIDLNIADTSNSDTLRALEFGNYDIVFDVPVKIENNGYSFNIELPVSPNTPYISGADLPQDGINPARFNAKSIHGHWGSSDEFGSEHFFNGTPYSLEIHIVHYNSKYRTLDEAANNKDGLAVVGLMFKVASENSNNPRLVKTFDAIKDITKFGQSTEIRNFVLGDFTRGLRTHSFFTYSGSLTTPGCNEVVTWHVMASVVPMSSAEIQTLRSLTGKYDVAVENNYRGLQPKNNRPVQYYNDNLSNVIDTD